MWIYFDHFLIGLWNFGEVFLVHCTVSVHSRFLWTNFEGAGFLYKLVDGETIYNSHWILIKEFYFQVEGPYNRIIIYYPILSLLLHSPTLSCWGRTCWSGACALLSIFDAQDEKYDVCLCNHMPICYVIRNIRNTCMKGLHSHALELLVFMDLASILE